MSVIKLYSLNTESEKFVIVKSTSWFVVSLSYNKMNHLEIVCFLQYENNLFQYLTDKFKLNTLALVIVPLNIL